jgi:hypothetical protein
MAANTLSFFPGIVDISVVKLTQTLGTTTGIVQTSGGEPLFGNSNLLTKGIGFGDLFSVPVQGLATP